MTTRADCIELDRSDPLAVHRAAFALPDGVVYLDGNSLGALPRAAGPRVREGVEREWGEGLIRSWNDARWIDLPRGVGAKIGRLTGARSDEVTCADSTSLNLSCGGHAVQRVRMQRKIRDFIFAPKRSVFE